MSCFCFGGICVPYSAVFTFLLIVFKWVADKTGLLGLLPESITKRLGLAGICNDDCCKVPSNIDMDKVGKVTDIKSEEEWATVTLLKTPGAVVYTGCIGNDESGKTLGKCATDGGVTAPYLIDEETPTGKCAVLITDGGKNRSLVTSLAAANNFKHSHAESEGVDAQIKAAQFYYTAGFFQTVSPDTVIHIGKHAAEENKVFTTNLSAPFLMQVPPFLAAIQNTIQYTDILFGNETEAAQWAESNGWSEKTVSDIALKLAAEPKANDKRPRIVVFTQGENPTIVATEGKVTEYPIIPCPQLVDTNGAGDAFVGGFLSKLAMGEDIQECCRAGNYAANVIIQTSGTSIPAEFEVPAKP